MALRLRQRSAALCPTSTDRKTSRAARQLPRSLPQPLCLCFRSCFRGSQRACVWVRAVDWPNCTTHCASHTSRTKDGSGPPILTHGDAYPCGPQAQQG